MIDYANAHVESDFGNQGANGRKCRAFYFKLGVPKFEKEGRNFILRRSVIVMSLAIHWRKVRWWSFEDLSAVR